MRYIFTPSDKTRIRLFANSFEAAVFWIATAGLVFLIIITFYRSYYLKNVTEQYNAVAAEFNPAIIQIGSMIALNDSLTQEIQNLNEKIEKMQLELNDLHSQITMLKKVEPEVDTVKPAKTKRKLYLPLE